MSNDPSSVSVDHFQFFGDRLIGLQAHASDPYAACLRKPKLFKRPTRCPPATSLQTRAESPYLMRGSSGSQLLAAAYTTSSENYISFRVSILVQNTTPRYRHPLKVERKYNRGPSR
ncbi:hypothetical protein K443DRAFT_15031 [Laccaria amethystina LaAM-08-1]|uniref:Uncharacterized protein n=1 Tax=Laccaria amethystina LaAM-08-1 TaxID=1095629 RepID=A0A0C9WZC1_9AGAR|nr:hypothetical protein K443DRAFT_15031 [Laccaria amethystina LaAM-08-1]